MKLNKKNKPKKNCPIKRPSLNIKKNFNLVPLFIQITKKNMILSQKKEDESSLNRKKKNSIINNSSQNNNNNIHSSSSLCTNFVSPVNNINKNSNIKNRKKKASLIYESTKNNMILTYIDNSSIIGSKEKIILSNQNNCQKKKDIKYQHKKNESINNVNNIMLNKGDNFGIRKKTLNKKHPLTSLNSRKNSIDSKNNNPSLFQRYHKHYAKNTVDMSSNRNKIFKSTIINTCSNKNLFPNSNTRISFGFSCFNNYIKNLKFQKALNKNIAQNITHFLYNNKIKKFYRKKNVDLNKKNKNISQTAKVSPRLSFMNNNSKSSKIISSNKNLNEENIKVNKNKSKIYKIIKKVNIGKLNKKNKITDNNIISNFKNRIKNNTNYNSFNNFLLDNNNYNNYVNNVNNINNANNNGNNNFDIINNCQTTLGAFYNNFNININNQINNHIINNNNKSRKKLNNINLINNKNNRTITQSQQELIQKKKNINKHLTSSNTPYKLSYYKILSRKKKFFFILNHLKNESNKNSKSKLKNKFYSKIVKKNKGQRNNRKNKRNSKIKSKSTEKLELQFKLLKNELSMNGSNNFDDVNNNLKLNDKEVKSCDELNINHIEKEEMTQTNNNKKNIYMEDSLKLINYIKNYYKKNHEYPKTNLDFYKYGRLIGQGAFGKVNLGLNVLTGRVVAIKSFNKKSLDSPNNENMKKIIYETNLMRKLNHPNITKILEMFEDEKYILIIMEYINGGNLFSFVKKRRKLSEKISKFLFKQIILGINHIHSQNIVHRDIKLENILIDINNNIKICDFGIGRILSSPHEILYDQCGTPMYMAPEILTCSKEKGYKAFPVDIWSAGIALYIMLSGTLPFNIKIICDSLIDANNKHKMKNIALRKAIVNEEPKRIENISDNARNLLHGLLNKDPNKRLTCDEILRHPWINSEDNNNGHHLFTKAEMIMLSKTYIDYRKANMDDIQENFTISNLKRDKNINNNNKNITTKSFILTPYSSLIEEDDESEPQFNISELDDFNNENINIEHDLISFSNKVKEFNMLYELNNNNEVDNGMLINSKVNSTTSWTNRILNNNSVIKTESVICVEEEDKRNEYNEGDNIFHKKVYIKSKNKENYKEVNINKILEKIEKFGYDKKYVKYCLDNNVLCHATSVFFLLINYDNI